MTERKKIWKWFWVWDFEKEERWLNEMAMQGWVLCGVGFSNYTFERCEPGEYTVRLEMRPHDEAYVDFMRETGAEFVGRLVAWVYFRKRAEDGPFDLFSDLDSRVAHLSRIARFLKFVGLANLIIGAINAFDGNAVGVVNLLCATLLMYALGRIEGKKEALERERELHE